MYETQPHHSLIPRIFASLRTLVMQMRQIAKFAFAIR